jgi:hypothetical protein
MTGAAPCLDGRVFATAVSLAQCSLGRYQGRCSMTLMPDWIATWGANGRFDGASTLVVDYGIKAATVTRRSEHRLPR